MRTLLRFSLPVVAIAINAFVFQDTTNAQNAPLLIPSETASPTAPRGDVEGSAAQPQQPQELTPAATQFIKGMALILLPPTYTDDDDWGQTKKIQSGLNVKLDGLEVKTSRRWKDVKHGLWRRVDAKLVDPENLFDLKIWLLPSEKANQPKYHVTAKLRLAVTVRQQRWTRGVKVYSVSSDIVTDVSVDTVIDFRSKLVDVETEKRLQILPHVQTANMRVDRFSIRRISHAKGGAVREFGRAFEGLVRQVVARKSKKLPAKINSKIEKKADKFQVSVGMLKIFGLEANSESSAQKTSEDKATEKG